MKKRFSLFLLTCLLLPLGICACNNESPVDPETLTVAGEDISNLVPPSVKKYSQDNHLYV